MRALALLATLAGWLAVGDSAQPLPDTSACYEIVAPLRDDATSENITTGERPVCLRLRMLFTD